MLIFVLSTKNRLVVSVWTFFQYLGNQGELEKNETTKNYCWCRECSKVTLDNHCSAL